MGGQPLRQIATQVFQHRLLAIGHYQDGAVWRKMPKNTHQRFYGFAFVADHKSRVVEEGVQADLVARGQHVV